MLHCSCRQKDSQKAKEVTNKLSSQDFEAEYLSVSKQKSWLKNFPKLREIIPYNSDNRRNIGYLYAKKINADIIISIDDDNWPRDDKDYLEKHSIVGSKKQLPQFSSKNGWYNICRHLDTNVDIPIYPRGFPYSKRWHDTRKENKGNGRIVINAGLWLQDPDVDAVTNLNYPVKVKGIESNSKLLAKNNFCPY